MNKLKIILYLFIMLVNSQTNTVERRIEPEIKKLETEKAIIYMQKQSEKNVVLCNLNKLNNHINCVMKDLQNKGDEELGEHWYYTLEILYQEQQKKKEQKE